MTHSNGKRPLPMVYLAGPIDYVTEAQGTGWRRMAEAALHGHASTYDPRGAFTSSAVDSPAQLRAINEYAVQSCDGVLAYVDATLPSWGTPSELIQAETLGLPVVLYSPLGNIPPYFAHLPARRSLAGAVAELLERIAAGDTRRPRLGVLNGGIASPALDGDAGHDLRVREAVTLNAQVFTDGWQRVPIGTDKGPLRLHIPPGYWAMPAGRSSLVARGVMVSPTVIDEGYRGPVFVFAANLGKRPVHLERGERIGQLVFFRTHQLHVEEVAELPDSERSTAGFGSTGKH